MRSGMSFQDGFAQLLGSDGWLGDPALRRAVRIHREAHISALLDVLGATFPVVGQIVGPSAFAECARGFAKPTIGPKWPASLLAWRFTAFLGNWPPFRELPYLAAIASLECLIDESRKARNAALLEPNPWARNLDLDCSSDLHPANRIRAFPYPVVDLWHAHQPGTSIALEAIELGPQIALVTRPTLEVAVCAVDEATSAFLTAPTLRAGACAAGRMAGDITKIFARLLIAGAYAERDKTAPVRCSQRSAARTTSTHPVCGPAATAAPRSSS